jgi:hypothetical protein
MSDDNNIHSMRVAHLPGMTYRYRGGESESELIRAATGVLDITESDAVEGVKRQVFPLGSIMEIALARNYCKPNVAGWCAVKFGRSDTYFRQCLKAWKFRHTFDAAVQWVQGNNECNFRPMSLHGPKFCIELCEAYLDRNKSESERLNEQARKAESRRKSKEAKEAKLRAQIQREQGDYRQYFERVAKEHRQWATDLDRDPRELNAIETEIAERNGGNQNDGFEFDNETDGSDPSPPETEPNPQRAADSPEPDEPESLEPDEPETVTPSANGYETMAERPPETIIDVNPVIVPPAEPEPAAIVPFQRRPQKQNNPWAMLLKDVSLTDEQYDIIKAKFVKSFKGKRGGSDHLLEDTQVRFFYLVGQHLMPAQLDLMQRQKKNFWEQMRADYTVTPSNVLANAK